ncbi:hypothetical protein ACFLXE_00500 [Chloroflexota bacterium]
MPTRVESSATLIAFLTPPPFQQVYESFDGEGHCGIGRQDCPLSSHEANVGKRIDHVEDAGKIATHSLEREEPMCPQSGKEEHCEEEEFLPHPGREYVAGNSGESPKRT